MQLALRTQLLDIKEKKLKAAGGKKKKRKKKKKAEKAEL